MQLQPVKSRLITAVGYDPGAQELVVQFRGTGDKKEGAKYRYPNVTQEQFDELMSAKSIGAFYMKNFRGNNDHPAVKVEEAL